MAWIISAIVGGIIGLIYGSGINAGRRLYMLFNFLIGVAGGVLGVWFFFLVLGIATTSLAINMALLVLWSIVGAIILMAVIDAINYIVYRSRMRREDRLSRRRETRERHGYAHGYEVEEEEHKIKRKRK